MSSVQALNVI